MTKRIELKVEVIYLDTNRNLYLVTPDGIGVWWYDTLEEAREAHGDDVPVYETELED
jgi:hypothetical protein